MKIVGQRRTSEDLSPISPAEALARAERWRKAQPNPRLW